MENTKKIKISTKDIAADNAKLFNAQQFAKALAQQVIHDPSGKTSRRATRTYSGSTYTRETIDGFLESPSTSEKSLRDASIFLYQTNSRYRNLLNYYANLPCWIYVVTPLNYNPDKVKAETFRKQYQKVMGILESMGVVKHMREVTLAALREGVYYGAIWGGDGSSFVLQKLDPDNCQIVSIGDGGVFQFTYDMSKVKEADLATHYPPEFMDMWDEYRRSGNQHQVVPPEISVCVKADPSIVEYSVPPFAAVMPYVYSIKNAEEQADTSSEMSNYKLIAGKIETDDDGVPVLDYATAMQYYAHIANNVGDRVGVAVTPFDLKSYDFEQSGTTAQVDIVSRATDNFFASAGTTALLHGAKNTTAGVTKLAIRPDESFAFGFMYQCEKVINRFLKTLSGTVKFKTRFLDVSIFNREEMLSKYKEAMNYGMGKLEYMACLGIPQHDILGKNYIETGVLDLDNILTPVKTAATQSADNDGAGRPEETDAEIDDEGEATRDNDSNANR